MISTQNKSNQLYRGIVASDNFIHNHINEILNLFNGKIVKILSNAKVKKYVYKDGVKTNEVKGYDELELNRNANGCANILVKSNSGSYWSSDYIYVSSSVLYENDSTNAYFSVPLDFMKIADKYKQNKFLVYSKLDDLWFAFSYKDVYDDYIKNGNDSKHFYNYKGNHCYKYQLNLSNGRKLDKTPNQNAKYFENVHIGVTRYSTSIAGTHCFVRVFSKATGKPTTKQPNEYKSISDAYNNLNKFIHIASLMTKRTFATRVHKVEFIEYGDFIFQCATDPSLLKNTLEVIKEVEVPYYGVVEMFKSFGEIVSDADVEIAKSKGMTYPEFIDYCMDKYNAKFDEGLLLTEVVSPEDIEAVDVDSCNKVESWYRNLTEEQYHNIPIDDDSENFNAEVSEVSFNNENGEFVNPFQETTK